MKKSGFIFAFLATACGTPKPSETSASLNTIYNRRSPDITVLKSFSTQRSVTYLQNIGPGDVRIDLSTCRPLSGDISIGTSLQIDCSEAAALALASQASAIYGPIAGQLIIHAQPEEGFLSAPTFSCTFQEIQTITREAAFATSTGIGFYYNGTQRTVAKRDLVQVGRAQAKNGDSVVIHRFQAAAYCWAGTATSSARTTYAFRPYLEFQSSFGDLYRNWDTVPSDYVVSYMGAQGFDRSAELLR